MANFVTPILGETPEDFRRQIYENIRSLFEDKVGGLNIGDVFGNTGDMLTLEIASSGGLQKVDNELSILANPDDALTLTSDGLGIADCSTTKHGALPTLPNDANQYFNGAGNWVTQAPGSLVIAGTITAVSLPTERNSVSWITFETAKSCTFANGGVYRLAFELRGNATTGDTRMLKNGSPYGTTWQDSTGVYTACTADVTVDVGDVLDLQYRTIITPGGSVDIKNFTLKVQMFVTATTD